MPKIKNENQSPSYLQKHKWPHLFCSLVAIASIMIYLWWLRRYFNSIDFFVLFLGFTLFVNGLSREGASKIGLWPQDFKKCFRERTEQLLALAGLLLWWIILSGNVVNLANYDKAEFLGKYILVGLVQQYILNGFFVNRLIGLCGSESNKIIPLIAASMFSLVHLPNWFLMAATYIGGYLCVKIFLEHRNLYFLALAHGLVAFLLFHSFSESVTHHFVVGIKYFAN